MSLLDYPGNLGSVRGSILTVHHCDWPTYPEGEDFRETLFHLSAFPHGVEFVEVDDCDRSILFVADISSGALSKPYQSYLHVCSWHEDLIDMHNRGFITGVELVTQNAYECGRWNKVLDEHNTDKLYTKIDGELREIPCPAREPDDDDDDDEPQDWVLLPSKRISVTTTGIQFIVNEIKHADIDFSTTLSPTVSKLLQDGLYDTAVREACITLEHSIKTKLESNKYGNRLTDKFFDYLRNEENVLESSLRTYSQELRRVFKLVRNLYMHNLNTIDESTVLVLLFRISRVKIAVDA